MKRIVSLVTLLVLIPFAALANKAAPYTEEALQEVIRAIGETPKNEVAPDTPREEFHRQFVQYYSQAFDKAGYSFFDTIDQIAADLEHNPEAIPSDHQSVYNNLYILLHVLMYECKADKVDCLQFFPEKTRASVQWIIDNSGFGTDENSMHHKAAK